MEFCLLNGEVAEAFDAWRKGRQDVGEELAGSAIYLLGLAEMVGVDLQNEIARGDEPQVRHRAQSTTTGDL